jgi:hypothetical protein
MSAGRKDFLRGGADMSVTSSTVTTYSAEIYPKHAKWYNIVNVQQILRF